MSLQHQNTNETGTTPPITAFHMLALMLPVIAAGAVAALAVMPTWLPLVSTSLLGREPKAYWYLARMSALVAYALLWLSMVVGLSMSNRLARVWPGGPTAFDLHQHTSLLGLAFALFHALVLLGDRYIGYTLTQVLVPFASAGYRPLPVGLGQVGLYLLAVVALSFYVRRITGYWFWRVVHFLSFAIFLLALAHGLWSGTDSAALWVRGLYWASGGSILFLTLYRLLAARRAA